MPLLGSQGYVSKKFCGRGVALAIMLAKTYVSTQRNGFGPVWPVSGLVAADYFAPGYFVWAVLIANLARVGYEEKNMYMAAYDWRLSFQNTENYRGIAPGVLNADVFQLQTLHHIMRMSRTWDSTMSMIPKGGETIWGGLDWSPEEGYFPSNKTHKKITTSLSSQNESNSKASNPNYGRFISFRRDVAELHSSQIERIDFRDAVKGNNFANSSCREVWTEYHDMGSGGIKAIAEYKTYTDNDLLDMLEFVAPKMMKRGNAHTFINSHPQLNATFHSKSTMQPETRTHTFV
ncbi:hypothetical protein L1987_22729 [Smallanthus sonchifolius]|uniref:Uncharacterized protein n=1 Tax=Smallanthus sonchifolius TaxID=185202 RepID=A0ACB9IEY3_9ASTR|nr:hypothetical protein L1987_22729 [Smallanthus sonchifolius]